MALVQRLNQIFVNAKCLLKETSKNKDSQNQAMNFTTGGKISEI